jgi:hypothetical protein
MAYNKGQKSNAGRIVPANLPVFVVVEDESQLPRVYGLDDLIAIIYAKRHVPTQHCYRL